MDSVVDILQLPSDDRNIRIIEYQQEYFTMKPPYELLIEISMFVGRSKDTKRKLYHTIVSKLESKGLIDKEKVLITLNEQSVENWGVRGGIPADELDLGFNINA